MRWKSTEIGVQLSCKCCRRAHAECVGAPSKERLCWCFLGAIFCLSALKLQVELISQAQFLHGGIQLVKMSSCECLGEEHPLTAPLLFAALCPPSRAVSVEHPWDYAETAEDGFVPPGVCFRSSGDLCVVSGWLRND